eukprot:CAMPEP_0195534578 /NCGR_PEP_ID=MMETSP0794_2-20130614/42659_1 /TAXON_ID=515487 /ORGANISM="Stephanopyxis turris, Strain CCMP 815" /LENGTH=59 /DNA_ID=CAMNT_0040667467 /DNA_START=24 /DNA_END=200 /DNA_ORIENTATION=-
MTTSASAETTATTLATAEKKEYLMPSGEAMLRQKERKTNMSGTPIQLAVDLHNEGIVVH